LAIEFIWGCLAALIAILIKFRFIGSSFVVG